MADTNDMNLNVVWNTLMFFAHPDSYVLGERTGGVLQGCPRKPPPSPDEMASFAKFALGALREYVGGSAEQWMLDGKPAPTARLPEDWKLVPIQPTSAMLEAAYKAFQLAAPSLAGFMAKERAYRALLDHAPEPPKDGVKEVPRG